MADINENILVDDIVKMLDDVKKLTDILNNCRDEIVK